MRILLIYPGHAFSTLDVAEGYVKVLASLGHNVRPYNYHQAISFYGQALAYNPEMENAGNILANIYRLASEHVIIDVIDYVPDVVLIVNGFRLHRRAFHLLHRLDVPTVILLTESPYQDQTQSLIMSKGFISLAFANDKNSAEPLQNESGVKCIYLPHSFDPDIHYSDKVGSYFHSDVFFQGTLFPERKELFEGLSEMVKNGNTPLKINLGGVNIDGDEFAFDEDEVITNDEVAKRYRGTKIALNLHRVFIGVDGDGNPRAIDNTSAYSIGPRAYEIAACKTFQICDNTRQELTDLFGEAVVTYDDKMDLVSKINYYLAHPTQREELAQLAWERVQGCTFKSRAEQIVVPALESLGG